MSKDSKNYRGALVNGDDGSHPIRRGDLVKLTDPKHSLYGQVGRIEKTGRNTRDSFAHKTEGRTVTVDFGGTLPLLIFSESEVVRVEKRG